MSEAQFRELLERTWRLCSTEDLGERFVGLVKRTIMEEPARSWFLAWKRGEPMVTAKGEAAE